MNRSVSTMSVPMGFLAALFAFFAAQAVFAEPGEVPAHVPAGHPTPKPSTSASAAAPVAGTPSKPAPVTGGGTLAQACGEDAKGKTDCLVRSAERLFAACEVITEKDPKELEAWRDGAIKA